ncbi:MAG TPA: NAD(P)/FAD-dependent oxidoreductase [Puia sp.]|nr:NAD(P)/FAD-dependent oxidoreductase [Puia sp.]
MQKTIQIKLLPSEAASDEIIRNYCAKALGQPLRAITGFHILRRSIDARGRQARILMSLLVFIDEPFLRRTRSAIHFKDVSKAGKKVIVIGAGPAGLFAALSLMEAGIQPILLERGKAVRERRRDLAILNKEGIINPESNYCFGEGGAGTYSDGKLYTRSSKRGDINRILNILVQFGAEENILFDAHPHIGTNKLPNIITAIRQQLVAGGAAFHFEKKVTELVIENDSIVKVICSDKDNFSADAVILATGHSARDIFQLLQQKKILIEFKDFALGVRVEHPQSLIDSIQYGVSGENNLPPASYSLVEQVTGKGVFSFCMCPGGIIAPAATSAGELVVNGWSPSKRNNPYANSGIVVAVDERNVHQQQQYGALAGMHFQQMVEVSAFQAGGGNMVAPAQRMTDFVNNKISTSFPACSYLPGIHAAALKEVLPPFIHDRLRKAFVDFGKKMKGYYTEEAVVVATESRTSSPVRIPRHPQSLRHPQISNLYPCGEGAGYAGGIVSAAMDGERVARQLVSLLS